MRALITGGAGFIGCNLAASLARGGHTVVVADNLSRRGSAANLKSLAEDLVIAPLLEFCALDVRDPSACRALLASRQVDCVVHLAGQVAVTGSIADPVTDFDVNARGTLNILEAVRHECRDAHVLFASTNKVYGSLRQLGTVRLSSRYHLPDYPAGIPETLPTNAATPYGCSKLAADGYVRDYGRTFGLRTTVFRMSCIYGCHQNGTADQGWVSWFVRAALTNEPLTIYGDGLQVRDMLHVDDLVELMGAVLTTGVGAGDTFNVGGGPAFAMSVWAEFGGILEDVVGHPVDVRFATRRLDDQDVYMSDISHVCATLPWTPRTAPREGVEEVAEWMRATIAAEAGRAKERL